MFDRAWLLTWTTYGSWLPGDERGFVSYVYDSGERIIHNEAGTECDRDVSWLREYARSIQTQEATLLTPPHAVALAEQLRETAGYRRWLLPALAVMANHVHLVVLVPGDPDPEKLLHSFKSYGSRRLNRVFGERKWWTSSGSTRKLPDERAIRAAVRYVQRQSRSLRVEIDEAWLPTEPGEPCV